MGPAIWLGGLALLLTAAAVGEAGGLVWNGGPIAWGAYAVDKQGKRFLQAVVAMAERLKIDPGYLLTIMVHESAGTLSPSVRNASSNAVGLIQFLPSTAKELGTTDTALSQMSAVAQLAYVEKYFLKWKKIVGLPDWPNIIQAYGIVFSPKNAMLPAGTVLFREGSLAYQQNPNTDRNHDGVVTRDEALGILRDKYQKGLKLYPWPPPPVTLKPKGVKKGG